MDNLALYILSGITTAAVSLFSYILKNNDKRVEKLEKSLDAQSTLLVSVKEDALVIKALMKE